MITYIHELKNWPEFTWDQKRLAGRLGAVHQLQGRLLERMESLGFKLQKQAVLQTLTEEVLRSSEIEGEILDKEQVCSSVARHLGLDVGGLAPADRHVEGIVEMMFDATQNFDAPLTSERLCAWHAALFPTGRSGMSRITVGAWRNDRTGPMQVISGPIGRERVHYEAPPAAKLENEMQIFLEWFNKDDGGDLIIKAGIAHLWFVTIHPFDDGNGRIARAVTDMVLARSEKSAQRFYSMSAQIQQARNDYYDFLEAAQKGSMDVTNWLDWFIGCLGRAFGNTEMILAGTLRKSRFWRHYQNISFNDRQRRILNQLFDGFEGKLTSSKWAKLANCSQDTALRDIDELFGCFILSKNPEGGRSTSYSLNETPAEVLHAVARFILSNSDKFVRNGMSVLSEEEKKKKQLRNEEIAREIASFADQSAKGERVTYNEFDVLFWQLKNNNFHEFDDNALLVINSVLDD